MAQPEDSNRLPRDPALKAIFSHPRMIADALRGYAVRPRGPLDPRTVAALDYVEDARRAALDLAAFQLRHTHFALAFHPYREDDPRADNAMSLQIALESASTWTGWCGRWSCCGRCPSGTWRRRCWSGRCGGWTWTTRRRRR